MPAPHPPSILIFSDEEDAHISLVLPHLDERTVATIGPRLIYRGRGWSYLPKKDSVDMLWEDTNLNAVQSVWYRKPSLPRKEDLPVSGPYVDYTYDALRKHFTWLLDQFTSAFWISDYYALLRASNKMTQLSLAAQLGFRVPDTVLTSEPARAKQFLDNHASTIIKPISVYGFPFEGKDGEERPGHFFAAKWHRGETVNLANLELAPSIFQEAVEDVEADIRVTVVGSTVFAAAITNPGFDESKGIRDWRVGHYTDTIRIVAFDLPPRITKLCVRHVKELGLQFGAIDLVLDKKGRYWFLENNPNGQWGFVQEETKQPIGAAIAHLLTTRHHI